MNVLFVGIHPDEIGNCAGDTTALYAKQDTKMFFAQQQMGKLVRLSG